jgi:hypothetical protein
MEEDLFVKFLQGYEPPEEEQMAYLKQLFWENEANTQPPSPHHYFNMPEEWEPPQKLIDAYEGLQKGSDLATLSSTDLLQED